MTPFVQFDFADSGGRWSPCRFVGPVEVVSTHRIGEVLPALRRVQAAVSGGLYAAGFLAYEAAPAFDAAMATPPPSDLPLLWFGLFERAAVIDVPEGRGAEFDVGRWESSVDGATIRADIESIRESIAAGDFYQVNLTTRMRAHFNGDALCWYRHLRSAQGASVSGYLDIGRFQILSLSPELFFQVSPTCGVTELQPVVADGYGDRTIMTRPMKGTHARGRWTEEDLAFRERLRTSAKERAENLMIVDLLRNDLGRIAETSSVRVEEMFRVEPYPTLLQMTSSISASLRGDIGLPEIMSALFPCGSVTGAPKIAAMRRIAAIELEPRGIYCGTIGYMAPDGRSAFNVAIRTILVDRETGVAEYGVGSGITWESRADAEVEESRLKSAVLSAPAGRSSLFETLRLECGHYSRLDRHLARIIASAAYYGISTDAARLRALLDECAAERRDGVWRTRLILAPSGEAHVECEPLEDAPSQSRDFVLARAAVDRGDPRLFHKLVDRAFYAARRAECSDAYDVLMLNAEGELTEFTTGNLVLGIDGERLTPPLDCGLLPGVFRAHLVDGGEIRERVLFPADIGRAQRVWLINSLRGWVPILCRS